MQIFISFISRMSATDLNSREHAFHRTYMQPVFRALSTAIQTGDAQAVQQLLASMCASFKIHVLS
eukprot:7659927-Karenia_brevis.AAC.1